MVQVALKEGTAADSDTVFSIFPVIQVYINPF